MKVKSQGIYYVTVIMNTFLGLSLLSLIINRYMLCCHMHMIAIDLLNIYWRCFRYIAATGHYKI